MKKKITIVVPAYNEAKTLEKTYNETVYFNFCIGCVPVPVRYFPSASSIDFINSSIYGIKTLNVLRKYLFQKSGLKKHSLFARNK
jgi:hypothetical protein